MGRSHWLEGHGMGGHLDCTPLVDDGLWHGSRQGLSLHAVRGLHKTDVLSILVYYRRLDGNPLLAVHAGLLNLNGLHVLNHLATQLLPSHCLLWDVSRCHGFVCWNLVRLTRLEWFRSCHQAFALPLVFGLLDSFHSICDVTLRRNVAEVTG